MKSYTDLEQSKKLAEILPIESADMTLPFRHPKNDEYIPGYVASRNYVEVYNEMMKLPAMEKENVCKLIQPSWSFAALFGALPKIGAEEPMVGKLYYASEPKERYICQYSLTDMTDEYDNPVDACYEMIIKLNELKML